MAEIMGRSYRDTDKQHKHTNDAQGINTNEINAVKQ